MILAVVNEIYAIASEKPEKISEEAGVVLCYRLERLFRFFRA